MRDQIRPTTLRALQVAEELMPEPLGEFAGLPTAIRVQCRLFDALVLLAAARHEAKDRGELDWARFEIDALCHKLERLLDRFVC